MLKNLIFEKIKYNSIKIFTKISFIAILLHPLIEYRVYSNNLNLNLDKSYFNKKTQNPYILGAGDLITIKISELFPEIPKIYRINGSGKIDVSRIGDIYVEGLTIDELEKLLNDKYEEILFNSDISVQVKEYRNIRVQIRGEVYSPGLVSLKGQGDFVLGEDNNQDFSISYNNFPTLYEAHGFFHSTMTPPLVVAIFLGIFWRRYNTPAAVATFLGGALLMVIGSKYPEIFISPFDHGIEFNPDRPYSYIRALYNTFVCAGSGVVVGLLTSVPSEEKTEGLTIWSLNKAREYFKGGTPNDRPGKIVTVDWSLKDSEEDVVNFSINDMEVMSADVGDLVYVSDNRKWLGGLKSFHSVFGEPHNEDGKVYINKNHADSGMLDERQKLCAEKEL